MAEKTVTVRNGTIVLSGPDDPFSDGHTTGYLEFYDERHRPLFPLTSQTIQDHLMRYEEVGNGRTFARCPDEGKHW